jgi:hypothetical protein
MNPDDITQDPPKRPPSDRLRHKRKWLFERPDSPRLRLLRRRFVTWVSVIALVGVLGGLWVGGGAEARARTRVFRDAVEADLTRLEAIQDAYFSERGRFASLDELGTLYISSQGVRVRIHRADSTGWTASAWHLLTSRICTLTVARQAAVQAESQDGEPICR